MALTNSVPAPARYQCHHVSREGRGFAVGKLHFGWPMIPPKLGELPGMAACATDLRLPKLKTQLANTEIVSSRSRGLETTHVTSDRSKPPRQRVA